jgi:1,4-alpha-glucan branching enzyme
MTPVVRENYRIGMPYAGAWIELLNSDAAEFGGSGVSNASKLQTEKEPFHQYQQSLALTLAPLGVSVFKRK